MKIEVLETRQKLIVTHLDRVFDVEIIGIYPKARIEIDEFDTDARVSSPWKLLHMGHRHCYPYSGVLMSAGLAGEEDLLAAIEHYIGDITNNRL